MNGIPDNTSALISPQNAREAWLSLTKDRGVAVIDSAGLIPVTIPSLVQGVWTDLPQAIIANGGGMLQGALPLFWRMDVNGQLGYDYAADWPTVFVPPGYLRQVILTAVIEVALASGVELYEFAATEAGVAVPPFVGLDEAQNQDQNLVNLITATSTEVAAADRYSVAVRNVDGTSGLDVLAFGYLTDGGPPA
jgi:hypothetical protein